MSERQENQEAGKKALSSLANGVTKEAKSKLNALFGLSETNIPPEEIKKLEEKAAYLSPTKFAEACRNLWQKYSDSSPLPDVFEKWKK